MLAHIKIKHKFYALQAVIIISLSLISLLGLVEIRNSTFEDRKHELKNMVDAYVNAADYYQGLADNGTLDQDEAIAAYYGMLDHARFTGDIGYFFAYTPDGVNQQHVANPALVGRDLSQVKDSFGTFVVQGILDAGRGVNDGHFEYYWAKPGEDQDKQFAKFTHSGILPWGHAIATGIYVDDVDEKFYQLAIQFLLLALIAILISALLGQVISRDLTKTLGNLRNTMRALVDGDYSIAITGTNRKDELGDMADAVVYFKQESEAAENLRHSNERAETERHEKRQREILSMADNLDQQVRSVVNAIGQSINNLHGASGSMERSARNNADMSQEVAKVTEKTNLLAQKAVGSINKVIGSVAENAVAMAAAIEEQHAAINEIARNVNQAR